MQKQVGQHRAAIDKSIETIREKDAVIHKLKKQIDDFIIEAGS